MKKKSDDRGKDHEDEADDEAHDDAESSDDEGEEEERPVARTRRGRARPVRAAHGDDADSDHGHSHDDHDDDHDHDEDEDDEDPYWWAPHAVLSGIVIIGVLGFFGFFNRVAIALLSKTGNATPPVASAPATTTQPASTGANRPPMPMQPQQPPQARDMLGAKHLVVQWKGSKRAGPNVDRTQEQAKARCEEAAKKVKAGAKFEDVVKDYTDEPGGGARGGDLGRFMKGSMDPRFTAGVEKLKVGEVSGVVESDFGYHLILRTQ